jgi:F-type H+-transporting ATPase subunit b
VKRILIAALVSAVLACAQDAAHAGAAAETPREQHAEEVAQHGESHEEAAMPHEIWWKWANFAILIAGLGYLIGRNAGPFFRSRSEEIQRGIEESTRARVEAEARAAEIEARVSNLSAEVDRLRAQSHEEISREGKRMRAETETQIRKVQAQAEAEIASAAKHATRDLKAYSARLALQLAERQLRDRLSATAQDQLTDSFVRELREKAASN